MDSTTDANCFKFTVSATKTIAVYSHGNITLKGELTDSDQMAVAEDGDADSEDFLLAEDASALKRRYSVYFWGLRISVITIVITPNTRDIRRMSVRVVVVA